MKANKEITMKDLRFFIYKLPSLRRGLRMLYMTNYSDMTQAQIGAKFGVSPERVKQIRKETLYKIMEYKLNPKIADACDDSDNEIAVLYRVEKQRIKAIQNALNGL